MAKIPDSRGFVLPLVAVLLFSLMLLFTMLLRTAGRLNPVLLKHKADFENFYNAESAMMLHLRGFPSGYYPELPRIQAEGLGPWERICTVGGEADSASGKTEGELCLIAGAEPHLASFSEWANGVSSYRASLEKLVLEEGTESSLYGNRRFFQGEPLMSGVIRDGDLEVDCSDSIRRASFWVEGRSLFRGRAHFDTLRLYSLADVVFQGEVSVDYLELYTQGHFRAEGDVKFRGVAIASSFQIQDRVQGLFPAIVVAHGAGIPWGEITGDAVVDGTVDAPGGLLGVEDAERVQRKLLPAFMGGSRKIWGRL